MSMMSYLKQAKARAEQGEAAAKRLFDTIDSGVSRLEQHHDAVEGHFKGVLGFVEEMIHGGEEIVGALDGGNTAGQATPGQGAPTGGLSGVLDAFDHIDGSKVAEALTEATGVAREVVDAATHAYLGNAGSSIATALASAAEAAAGAGADGGLASSIAHAVQKVAHVLKDEPAEADARPVAQAVKANIDAEDHGGDSWTTARDAAAAAGADEATASRIAQTVATAP